MGHAIRILLVVVTVAAVILWLSAAPVPTWLLIAVVASVVFGLRSSVAQIRMERRWVRSLWMKWKSVV